MYDIFKTKEGIELLNKGFDAIIASKPGLVGMCDPKNMGYCSLKVEHGCDSQMYLTANKKHLISRDEFWDSESEVCFTTRRNTKGFDVTDEVVTSFAQKLFPEDSKPIKQLADELEKRKDWECVVLKVNLKDNALRICIDREWICFTDDQAPLKFSDEVRKALYPHYVSEEDKKRRKELENSSPMHLMMQDLLEVSPFLELTDIGLARKSGEQLEVTLKARTRNVEDASDVAAKWMKLMSKLNGKLHN